MANRIYTFSTTGNSLALARALAGELGETELVSMAKGAGKTAEAGLRRVGFVFPVHAWGLPGVMEEFIKGMKFEARPYIFAAATCGGTPGRALYQLRGLLKRAGAGLDAGFVCREGANAITEDSGFVALARRLNRRPFATGAERLGGIAEIVKAERSNALEKSSFGANCVAAGMRAMMGAAKETMKAYDRGYSVDGSCQGCGTCERLCPRGNVKLEGGKPVWRHDCGMCNACIQWCPRQAIHFKGETRRYRNPCVRAEDLAAR